MTVTDVVIGAASGMGEALARRISTPDRRLLLADRDLEGAQRLAAELGAEAMGCDITDDADLAAVAAAAGDLGALVVTAGLSPTMAPGRRIFEVDIIAPARLLDVFLPVAGAETAALLFASMAGHLMPDQPPIDAVLDRPLAPTFFDDLTAAGVDVDSSQLAYAYSKRALIRLIRREARAWGERGARLLTLSPGIIDTGMGRAEAAAEPAMAQMVAGSALQREIAADEIAAVAQFLISPAAVALSGTDVLVDGGTVSALLFRPLPPVEG